MPAINYMGTRVDDSFERVYRLEHGVLHAGHGMLDHNRLAAPGFKAAIGQGAVQPFLVAPHREIDGQPLYVLHVR